MGNHVACSDLQSPEKQSSLSLCFLRLGWRRSIRWYWLLRLYFNTTQDALRAKGRREGRRCISKSVDTLPSSNNLWGPSLSRSPTPLSRLLKAVTKCTKSCRHVLSSLSSCFLFIFYLSFSLLSMWPSLTATLHEVVSPSWLEIKWSCDHFHVCTIKTALSDSFSKQTLFQTSQESPESKVLLALKKKISYRLSKTGWCTWYEHNRCWQESNSFLPSS